MAWPVIVDRRWPTWKGFQTRGLKLLYYPNFRLRTIDKSLLYQSITLNFSSRKPLRIAKKSWYSVKSFYKRWKLFTVKLVSLSFFSNFGHFFCPNKEKCCSVCRFWRKKLTYGTKNLPTWGYFHLLKKSSIQSRVSLAILGDEKSSTIFGSILRLPQPVANTARYFSIKI